MMKAKSIILTIIPILAIFTTGTVAYIIWSGKKREYISSEIHDK